LIGNKGIGMVFETKNSTELSQKLQLLGNNSAQAVEMGKEAAKWVRQNYTDEIHYTNLLKIYNKVIDENRVYY
jgi:glycosyltransferase involved in cell wall biosynthesis